MSQAQRRRRGVVSLAVAHALLIVVLALFTANWVPPRQWTFSIWHWGVLMPVALTQFYLWLLWGFSIYSYRGLMMRKWDAGTMPPLPDQVSASILAALSYAAWLAVTAILLPLQVITGLYYDLGADVWPFENAEALVLYAPVVMVGSLMLLRYRIVVGPADPPPFRFTLAKALVAFAGLSLFFSLHRFSTIVPLAFLSWIGSVPYLATWAAMVRRSILPMAGLSLAVCLGLGGLVVAEFRPDNVGSSVVVFTLVYWGSTFASLLYLRWLGFAVVPTRHQVLVEEGP